MFVMALLSTIATNAAPNDAAKSKPSSRLFRRHLYANSFVNCSPVRFHTDPLARKVSKEHVHGLWDVHGWNNMLAHKHLLRCNRRASAFTAQKLKITSHLSPKVVGWSGVACAVAAGCVLLPASEKGVQPESTNPRAKLLPRGTISWACRLDPAKGT